MQEEGLLNIVNGNLKVTEKGMAFIRNIAVIPDARLHRSKKSSEPVFSKLAGSGLAQML